jgi:hypothetical protein
LLQHLLEPVGTKVVEELLNVLLEGLLFSNVEVDSYFDCNSHVISGRTLFNLKT